MKIYESNTYHKLKSLLLCYPAFFAIKDKNVNTKKMFEQYNNFLKYINDIGVKTYFLDPIYGENQVFVRDVGFLVDDIFFISKMSNKDRSHEVLALKKFLNENNIRVYEMKNNIEGGDVIKYGETLFIGLSSRTTRDAILEVEEYFFQVGKNIKIKPIAFDVERLLHLDCGFNVISKNSCLLSDFIYDKKIIEEAFEKVYYIGAKDSDNLGCNIVCIDDNDIISSNKEVSAFLTSEGVNVRYLDFSEFVNAGGSFTCATLSILREE